MSVVSSGDVVRVHYKGSFTDGEVFDSSDQGKPLEFTAGGQQVIPGVSQAVIGMAVGDVKTVTIPPDEGYGPREERLVQRVQLSDLPEGVSPGDPLQAQIQDQTVVFWVVEVDQESAVLDANHPLAGRDLVFELELVSFDPQ